MFGFRKKEISIISSIKYLSLEFIFILFIAAILFFAGCQSKKEEAKSPEEKTTQGDNTQTPANQSLKNNPF